jgi:hypothetical protein
VRRKELYIPDALAKEIERRHGVELYGLICVMRIHGLKLDLGYVSNKIGYYKISSEMVPDPVSRTCGRPGETIRHDVYRPVRAKSCNVAKYVKSHIATNLREFRDHRSRKVDL